MSSKIPLSLSIYQYRFKATSGVKYDEFHGGDRLPFWWWQVTPLLVAWDTVKFHSGGKSPILKRYDRNTVAVMISFFSSYNGNFRSFYLHYHSFVFKMDSVIGKSGTRSSKWCNPLCHKSSTTKMIMSQFSQISLI